MYAMINICIYNKYLTKQTLFVTLVLSNCRRYHMDYDLRKPKQKVFVLETISNLNKLTFANS